MPQPTAPARAGYGSPALRAADRQGTGMPTIQRRIAVDLLVCRRIWGLVDA